MIRDAAPAAMRAQVRRLQCEVMGLREAQKMAIMPWDEMSSSDDADSESAASAKLQQPRVEVQAALRISDARHSRHTDAAAHENCAELETQ